MNFNINLESVLPVLISVAVTWGMIKEKMKNMEKRDEEHEKKFMLISVFDEQRKNNENAHKRIFETIEKEEHDRKESIEKNISRLQDSITEIKEKLDTLILRGSKHRT